MSFKNSLKLSTIFSSFIFLLLKIVCTIFLILIFLTFLIFASLNMIRILPFFFFSGLVVWFSVLFTRTIYKYESICSDKDRLTNKDITMKSRLSSERKSKPIFVKNIFKLCFIKIRTRSIEVTHQNYKFTIVSKN